MRKFFLWYGLCLLLVLQSCVLKEDIYVSNSGEVDYKMEIDYHQLVENFGSAEVEKMLDQSGGFINQEPVTILEFFKESNKDKPEGQKELDSLMQSNPELKKIFNTVEIASVLKPEQANTYFEFKSKNIADFNQTLKSLLALSELGNSAQTNSNDPLSWINKNSIYSLHKNVFKREIDLGEVDTKMDGANLNMMQYEIKVSFDKRIKKVSYPDALLSQDGKSFIKTFDLTQVLNDPSVLQYSVELH